MNLHDFCASEYFHGHVDNRVNVKTLKRHINTNMNLHHDKYNNAKNKQNEYCQEKSSDLVTLHKLWMTTHTEYNAHMLSVTSPLSLLSFLHPLQLFTWKTKFSDVECDPPRPVKKKENRDDSESL